jgi:ribose transport system substrate-binding protein
VLTAALLAGPACRRGPPEPSAEPGATSNATDAVAAEPPQGQPVTGKLLRIALIAKSASNPSFLSAKTGAEDQAHELSAKLGLPIEITWLTPSQEDGRVQAQRIRQAVNERFDAILISCSNDPRVVEAIDDAVARGVAVMTFDSDAPTSRRFSYCGVDDELIGRQVMIELAALLPKGGDAKVPKATARRSDKRAVSAGPGIHHGDRRDQREKSAQIAVLAGNRDAPEMRLRVRGFMEEAATRPELEIVGVFSHAETAQDAAAELLRVSSAYPKVTGWAVLGGWPLYTKSLLAELQPGSGKTRHRIVSVNALPPQLVYVERGVAPVLLAQPTYLWGAVGVQTIVDKLVLGKAVPPIVPLDLVRVTADNLGAWARQLRSWGFGDVPEEYLQLK